MKMEQRKLSDQANTLVDLSKVRRAHALTSGRFIGSNSYLKMPLTLKTRYMYIKQHSSISALTCALVWLCVSKQRSEQVLKQG